jgi:hypothetical protein
MRATGNLDLADRRRTVLEFAVTAGNGSFNGPDHAGRIASFVMAVIVLPRKPGSTNTRKIYSRSREFDKNRRLANQGGYC